VIGRSRDCDLRLEDPSISRRHLRIEVGDCFHVEGLGGTNGTRVRGRALGDGERAEIAIGEPIFDESQSPIPEDPERKRIMDALTRCGGNQTRAAKLLGISRRTLTNRLNELALPRPRK
jgi:pSer/pThr/pTyr-binding forkhead associated (FHA) protein